METTDDPLKRAVYNPPTDEVTRLFKAAESGVVEEVQRLLDQGSDPNAQNRSGTPLLAVASSPEVARALLAAGARLDFVDDYDGDLLGMVLKRAFDGKTCHLGRVGVATLLLDAGVPLECDRKNGWTRVCHAAFTHQADAVDWLIAHGASLAPDSDDGKTPLHAICWERDQGEAAVFEQLVRSLVAAGISPDARDNAGRTPLHEATSGDGTNVVALRTLLELGASVDPVNNAGDTPLHLAAANLGIGTGPACITALLDAGADPLLCDRSGRLPFEIAQEYVQWLREFIAEKLADVKPTPPGHPRDRNAEHVMSLQGALVGAIPVVARLETYSVESDVPNLPEPAIHRAARLGDLVALERLLADGADINTEWDGVTPLMAAAGSMDGASVGTLRWLVDHGADVSTSDENETATWYAAGRGGCDADLPWTPPVDQTERLRFLLDAGLDPNERDDQDRPALLVEACAEGNVDNVRLLLERGAVLDTSLLFAAADSGSAECVALLLDQGLDPSTVHWLGESPVTPLSYAGSAEVVQVLLAHGACLDIPGESGFDLLTTILDRAMDGEHCYPGRAAAAQALLDAGIVLKPQSVYDAAFRHRADAADWLIARGASLEPNPDHHGMTPLHAICWSSGGYTLYNEPEATCEQLVRSLIAAGISADVRDPERNTPLHYAVGCDGPNLTATKTLLELGASAELANNAGQTPLHIAASQVGLGGNVCIAALLDAGANPLLPDQTGRTPLEIARRYAGSWENVLASERLTEARTGVALLLRSSPSDS